MAKKKATKSKSPKKTATKKKAVKRVVKKKTAKASSNGKVTQSKKGKASTYPWEKWIDRKTPVTLEKKDYNCTPESLRVMAYQRAREMNKKITVSVDKETGEIKISPRKAAKSKK